MAKHTRPFVGLFFVAMIVSLSASARFFPLGKTSLANYAMPTGNGFGFAVLSPASGALNAFYAHPYKYTAPNPADPHGEGLLTTNFLHSLKWGETTKGNPNQTHWREQSNVIQVARDASMQYFFLPFALEQNVLITGSVAKPGKAPECLQIGWASKTIGAATTSLQSVAGHTVRLVSFGKVADRLAMVALDGDGSQVTVRSGCLAGSSGWALLSLQPGDDVSANVAKFIAWQGGRAIADLVNSAVDEIEAWRVPVWPRLTPAEVQVWRQSEVMLRMAQIREPNIGRTRTAYGLINASLPPGEWFIPWVRDMSYAIEGLADIGHFREARLALTAMMNARTEGKSNPEAGGIDYQISTTRYFGNGMEEADYADGPDASGKTATFRNFELDDWGHAPRAIAIYLARSGDWPWLREKNYRGITNYESVRDFDIRAIYANLEAVNGDATTLITRPDTSFWEYNTHPHQHFSASLIADIKGVNDFLTMAEYMHDSAAATAAHNKIAAMMKGLNAVFVKNGSVLGTLESVPAYVTDAADIEGINWNVLGDANVVAGLIQAMKTTRKMTPLAQPNGYRRIDGEFDPYDKDEFVWVDFKMARAFQRTGDVEAAGAAIDDLTAKSLALNGMVAEEYVSVHPEGLRKVGDATGAIPMVGFGAGLYFTALYDRANPVTGW